MGTSSPIATPSGPAGRLIAAADGRVFALEDRPVVIGRHRSCDVVLEGADVSRRHATVLPSQRQFLLLDNSTNGLLVNGEPVTGSRPLVQEDIIQIGQHQLHFIDLTPAPAGSDVAVSDLGQTTQKVARRQPVRPTAVAAQPGATAVRQQATPTGKRELATDLRGSRRERLFGWIRRFWLPELAGLCAAVAGGWLAYRLTGQVLVAAYGGALGENLGFYGVLMIQGMVRDAHAAGQLGVPYSAVSVFRTSAKLFLTFGAAELLDSGLIRPFSMALGMRLLGPEVGILSGKFLADALFYLPVILITRWRSEHGEQKA